MIKKDIIESTINFVKDELANAEGGHDWWHIYRVWKTAMHIAEHEEVDIFIVELGALLHDIADAKFHDGDENIGPKTAVEFLRSLEVEENTIIHVENIIRHISFKGGNQAQTFKSPELDVVQDADRLDALGAIGIARTFATGSRFNAALYAKEDPFLEHGRTPNDKAYMVDHFFTKLFKLPETMQTKTGKSIAEERITFMKSFINTLKREIGD